MKKGLAVGGLWLAIGGLYLTLGAAEFKVDFSAEVGAVKPVNGVGQPPMIGQLNDWPMFRYLKEAGIPYSRLHDVGSWLGHGLYVDIPNLFRDFDADENDPKNYTFAYTDSLMKALDENGVEPFFRLGVTIENFVDYFGDNRYPAVRSDPPKDFAKWGRICEHVIRHYTEGWANGFKMKVTYWEIWNEPENSPNDALNPMFRAPFSEYMRLYGTVAPYLKEKFPHLKIGGYASCGFYAGVGAGQVAAAKSSPRTEHFVACAKDFLAAAREKKWPLDFFSYHSYSNPDEAMRQVRYADELLNSYGFTADRCERINNEWLPYSEHGALGTAQQAAGIAAELIGMQNGPCDLACIYDARCSVGCYSPLFDPMTYKPHKAYYAFTAFNELRKCGTAVKAVGDGTKGFHVTAAKGVNGGAVMLANDSDETLSLAGDFGGWRVVTCRLTDATHTDAVLPLPKELPPHAFAVVRLDPPDAAARRRLFLAGDSTLARRGLGEVYGSWGDALLPEMKDDTEIVNVAIPGRSSGSFRDVWKDRVERVLRPGDFVIVTFGHNDGWHTDPKRLAEGKPDRYCTIEQYRENLRLYVTEAQAKGAKVLFCTPISMLYWKDGKWDDTTGPLGKYVAAMREAAKELDVPCVDMFSLVSSYLQSLRYGKGVEHFAICADGTDITHPSKFGAERFAELFLADIRKRQLEIADLFK